MLIEERIRSFPTGQIGMEHVLGHATEDMLEQEIALEEHWLVNDQVDPWQKREQPVVDRRRN